MHVRIKRDPPVDSEVISDESIRGEQMGPLDTGLDLAFQLFARFSFVQPAKNDVLTRGRCVAELVSTMKTSSLLLTLGLCLATQTAQGNVQAPHA